MMCCSIEAKDRVIVIGYGFWIFLKTWAEILGNADVKT